jgi:hypothetical protein
MKDRYIFLLAAALIVAMFFFYFKGKKPAKVADETETEDTLTQVTPARKEQVVQTIPASADTSRAVIAPPKNNLSDTVLKNFATHMSEVQKCLHLTAMNVGAQAEPTSDTLLSLLKPSLGEPVVQIDDWSQFDLTDKSGTKKRVRVDYDYPDGVTPNRRLSSYTLNSYGALEIDNLTSDQTDNPNEAYIESLKEGAQVTSDERASRVYFSQGEEVAFSLRNGKLDSFNISKSEYSITCTAVSDENSKCSCP